MALKAIPTKHEGYRFRSRLEARWAVFFDALELPWDYELQGYDLNEAGWYLPDFVLGSSFIEVKPRRAIKPAEHVKASALADASGQFVLILCGDPLDPDRRL